MIGEPNARSPHELDFVRPCGGSPFVLTTPESTLCLYVRLYEYTIIGLQVSDTSPCGTSQVVLSQ